MARAQVRAGGAMAAVVAVAAALAALAGPTLGAIDADRIHSIPGFQDDPSLLPAMWSGYLNVTIPGTTTVASIHYWLVQSQAEGVDPATAPTVVWQQGGPGGSSLIGFFTELGPLQLNDASLTEQEAGVPRVFLNPHAWHLAGANMLFVEHPAPTGFSYCTGGPCRWDDHNQSEVNYLFYVSFFEQYPELAGNPFFLTGESYAGVLLPTLALRVFNETTEANKGKAPWSVSAIQLGNACPGNRVYTCTPYSGWIGVRVALDFRFGHGMISEDLYARINEACDPWWRDGTTHEGPPEGGQCRQLLEDPVRPCLKQAGDTYQMGGGYFLYDTCTSDMLALDPKTHQPRAQNVRNLTLGAAPGPIPLNSGEYSCGQDRVALIYLNLPEVQKAIHTKLVGKTSFQWSTGLSYEFTAYSLLEDYKDTLIPRLRITQYSGDADPCVPYVGTQRWIESLNLSIAAPWRPWTAAGPHENMVAGYVRAYEQGFTFVTVRDAGHMVPRYKPAQAFHMFKSFLDDKPL